VKFFCDDDFRDKAGKAQGFLTQVEQVQGTPAERAKAILADPGLSRLPQVQSVVAAALANKDDRGKDREQKALAGFIGKQQNLADTRCLADEPSWFHQAWLGFLIIGLLALYMIFTSLRALVGRGAAAPPRA